MKPSFNLRTLGLSGLILAAGAVTAIPVTLDLTTDAFGSETSFDMVFDPSGAATTVPFIEPSVPPVGTGGLVAAGDLASNTAYLFEWDLAPGNYDFVINDSFGDGGAAYTLTTPTQTFVGDGNYGSGETTNFSVPVPATLALFGLGLAGFGWSRSRARS